MRHGLSVNNAGYIEAGESHKKDIVARSIHQRPELERMENITVHAGVAEYYYNELAEEFIKSASDALSMSKKESKGK